MWSALRAVVKNRNTVHLILLRHEGGATSLTGRTLKERRAIMEYKDPKLNFKVDIGLPPPKAETKADLMKRAKYLMQRKNNAELERAARNLNLDIDIGEVTKEWERTIGPKQLYKVAQHYGIYDDLFGDAYFFPYVFMDISFPQNNGLEAPVYRGNIVKPAEASIQPNVHFESEQGTFWTLVLTNPDGHLTEENMEYVHWFVGNIPGSDISSGDLVWDYLPPFPPRGVGFQRFVFILYKQNGRMDFSSLKKQVPCLELKDRSFSTLEFYRERQDYITPAGLSFFQSDWDYSVIQTFHKILNMDEPIFEYDHEPLYVKEQKWFPKKKAFNLYIDNYRDPRDIKKEHLLRKVERLDPFKRPEKPFPFPNVHAFHQDVPSWYRVFVKRTRSNRGHVRDLDDDLYE